MAPALGQFALEFLGSAQSQSDRDHGNQRQNRGPGNNGSDELHQAGKPVDRPPEDRGVDQVHGAARQHESAEQYQHPAEGNLRSAHRVIKQDRGNRHVGEPDRHVRHDMQPSQLAAPGTAIPARRESRSVERMVENLKHETSRMPVATYRNGTGSVVKGLQEPAEITT